MKNNKNRIIWDLDLIRSGCERFYNEHGKYPTSHDFDLVPYLPSARTITQKFGNMEKFRSIAGQKIKNYAKGKPRSAIVRQLDERAKKDELHVYLKLVERFGEIYVHREKEFGFRNRVDFYIYHKNGAFGIDTFYPRNTRSLPNIFNIKEKKYLKFNEIIYLVTMNPEINSENINKFLNRRKKNTPNNIKLVTSDSFFKIIEKYKRMN